MVLCGLFVDKIRVPFSAFFIWYLSRVFFKNDQCCLLPQTLLISRSVVVKGIRWNLAEEVLDEKMCADLGFAWVCSTLPRPWGLCLGFNLVESTLPDPNASWNRGPNNESMSWWVSSWSSSSPSSNLEAPQPVWAMLLRALLLVARDPWKWKQLSHFLVLFGPPHSWVWSMVAPASDTRMELICLGHSLRVWEDDRTTGSFVRIMPFIITLWTLVQVYASCEQLAFKPPADRVIRQGLLGLFLAHLDLLRRACFPCSDSVLFGAQLPAHLSSHNYVPEVGVLNPAESPSLFHQENPLQPQCICYTLWKCGFHAPCWLEEAGHWWEVVTADSQRGGGTGNSRLMWSPLSRTPVHMGMPGVGTVVHL